MKRRAIILAILVVVAATACACGAASTATPSSWQLAVSGTGVQKELSMSDLEGLPSQEVEYTSKETGQQNAYTCVALREVLKSAGVDLAALQSVEIEADDLFLAKYGRELALEGEVYLAIHMDGGSLPTDMGRVRVIAPGQDTKMQVRYVRKITVK